MPGFLHLIVITLVLAAVLASPCNANPQYALTPMVKGGAVRRSGRVFTASATLRFHVREVTRAHIRSADTGLWDHARGHAIIARKVAESSVGSVRAGGSSATQAQSRLRQAIAHLASDAQRELDREEHVYDTVTEDGAAQSQGPVYGFPGGRDAKDTCSPQ